VAAKRAKAPTGAALRCRARGRPAGCAGLPCCAGLAR